MLSKLNWKGVSVMVNEILMSSLFWVVMFGLTYLSIQPRFAMYGKMFDDDRRMKVLITLVGVMSYLSMCAVSVVLFGWIASGIGYSVAMLMHWSAMQIPWYKRQVSSLEA